MRAASEPLVVPFPVARDTGRRFCTLASDVGDATVVGVEGTFVNVGIDVAVAGMNGVAVGTVVDVAWRVLIAVGVNVYVEVIEGILVAVGVEV